MHNASKLRLLAALLVAVTPFACPSALRADALQVVTSTQDMADFTKQVGGDLVNVYAIFKGQMDVHFFKPRPSHLVKLRRADVLVIGGLALDVWIQPLIDASRNSKIRFGRAGYVDPAHGVRPLQKPTGKIDGSMGDVHPFGNPHYWFTLANVRIVLDNITKGLSRNAPEHKAYFIANKKKYLKQVEATYGKLSKMLAPFKGSKVVSYHKSWDYFCKQFGLELIGSLEPKPGIPPSPAHLKNLIEVMKAERARLILAEPYYPDKPVKQMAAQTGAKPLRLPVYLKKTGTATYLDMLTKNVTEIVAALKQ